MLLLLLLATGTLAFPAKDLSENNEDTSRKILGSSVVTSVSVIMDTGNGTQTYFADAVGKPVSKPSSGTHVASPINLLNPDRYEFFTFDDNGDLIKRLMTMEEIQRIIAIADPENAGSTISYLPEKKVNDIVTNVQKVLNEEIKSHKNSPSKNPIFDTTNITSSWNVILPAFLGNNGDIMEKIPTSPDTDIVMLPTGGDVKLNVSQNDQPATFIFNDSVMDHMEEIKPVHIDLSISTKPTKEIETTTQFYTTLKVVTQPQDKKDELPLATIHQLINELELTKGVEQDSNKAPMNEVTSTPLTEHITPTSTTQTIDTKPTQNNIEISSVAKSTTSPKLESSSKESSTEPYTTTTVKGTSQYIQPSTAKPLILETVSEELIDSTTISSSSKPIESSFITDATTNLPIIASYSNKINKEGSQISSTVQPIPSSTEEIKISSSRTTSSQPSTSTSTEQTSHSESTTSISNEQTTISNKVVNKTDEILESTSHSNLEIIETSASNSFVKQDIKSTTPILVIIHENIKTGETERNELEMTTGHLNTYIKDSVNSEPSTTKPIITLEELNKTDEGVTTETSVVTSEVKGTTEIVTSTVGNEKMSAITEKNLMESLPLYHFITKKNASLENIDEATEDSLTNAVTQILDNLLLSSTNIYEINTQLSPITTDAFEDLTTEKQELTTFETVNPTEYIQEEDKSTTGNIQEKTTVTNEVKTTEQDKLEESTTENYSTVSSLIKNIEKLTFQAVANVAPPSDDDGFADEVEYILNNIKTKPMHQIQMESATIGSILLDNHKEHNEDDNKETLQLSEAVGSLLSQVYGHEQNEPTTEEDVATTPVNELITTIGNEVKIETTVENTEMTTEIYKEYTKDESLKVESDKNKENDDNEGDNEDHKTTERATVESVKSVEDATDKIQNENIETIKEKNIHAEIMTEKIKADDFEKLTEINETINLDHKNIKNASIVEELEITTKTNIVDIKPFTENAIKMVNEETTSQNTKNTNYEEMSHEMIKIITQHPSESRKNLTVIENPNDVSKISSTGNINMESTVNKTTGMKQSITENITKDAVDNEDKIKILQTPNTITEITVRPETKLNDSTKSHESNSQDFKQTQTDSSKIINIQILKTEVQNSHPTQNISSEKTGLSSQKINVKKSVNETKEKTNTTNVELENNNSNVTLIQSTISPTDVENLQIVTNKYSTKQSTDINYTTVIPLSTTSFITEKTKISEPATTQKIDAQFTTKLPEMTQISSDGTTPPTTIKNVTVWTLIPALLPHSNSTLSTETKPTINIQTPAPVKLNSQPSQGYGLEDSTTKLDTDVYQFVELCNELSFGFWNAVTTGISTARSVFVSPFAATSLLAMVFLGARGATSGEMNDILKLDDMVTFNPHLIFKNVTESIGASDNSGIAKSVIVRELFSDKSKGKLLSFYKERAKQFYDGYVEEVGFKNIGDFIRRRTNLLVKKYTNGKIDEYIRDNSLFVRPPLAGVSATIFQTDCSSASTQGRDGELHFVVLPTIRQRRLIPIPAVVYRNGFLAGYDPALDATAAAIGNIDQTISTIFVIPGQQGVAAPGDGLSRLEKHLVSSAFKQDSWPRLLRSLIPRPGLELQIPRFSHKSIINATIALQNMGLKDLFTFNKADLRGLSGVAHELHLSDILQINNFATCGEGFIGEDHHSEIYPATSKRPTRRSRRLDIYESDRVIKEPDMGDEPRDYQRAFHDPLHDPSLLSLPLPLRPRQARIPDAPRLRFDRPFLFIVRHNPTGLIVHMGRFNPRLLP